jgi:RHS repeat-associated protein
MINNYDINYFITDHLGSTRVIANSNGEIIEQKDFYPFGKEHENPDLITSTNRYTFSGKEKQIVGGVNFLDFSNRMYDDFTCRWTTQDPLQEERPWINSYAYCSNNPVGRTDPNGLLDDWYLNEATGELYFNRDLTTETTVIDDEEYTRIGDNDMMGDMGEITEQQYSATASQVVANDNGYDIEPVQQFEYINTNIHFDEVNPHHSVKDEVGTKTIITEKYDIVPYNSSPEVSNIIPVKQNASVLEVIILLAKKQATRYNYKYEDSTNPVRLDKGSYHINGTGVRREYYPSWKSYSTATKGKGRYLKYKP